MKDSREKVEMILDFLFGQLLQGLLYFQCSKSLHNAFQGSDLVKLSYFFAAVYRASLREAVLALARLVIDHRDSITIHYLLNYAENNSSLFSSVNPEEVRNAVKSHKVQLKKYEPLIESVREQRDRVLAHLDRKHINNPADLFLHPQGVNLTEVEECFQKVLEILNFYGGYYGREFNPKNLEKAVQGDVDILVGWMKEYGRPEEWVRPPVF